MAGKRTVPDNLIRFGLDRLCLSNRQFAAIVGVSEETLWRWNTQQRFNSRAPQLGLALASAICQKAAKVGERRCRAFGSRAGVALRRRGQIAALCLLLSDLEVC